MVKNLPIVRVFGLAGSVSLLPYRRGRAVKTRRCIGEEWIAGGYVYCVS